MKYLVCSEWGNAWSWLSMIGWSLCPTAFVLEYFVWWTQHGFMYCLLEASFFSFSFCFKAITAHEELCIPSCHFSAFLFGFPPSFCLWVDWVMVGSIGFAWMLVQPCRLVTAFFLSNMQVSGTLSKCVGSCSGTLLSLIVVLKHFYFL